MNFSDYRQSFRQTDAPWFATMNSTPFIDVALVLLCIFMLAIPLYPAYFRQISQHEISPPRERAAPLQQKSSPLVVHLSQKDTVIVAGREFTWDELPNVLSKIKGSSPTMQDRQILIVADKQAQYAPIDRLLKILKAQGLTEIGFVVRDVTQSSSAF